MRRYEYHRPATLDEARRLLAERPGAQIIAGGTDVMVRVREGRLEPPALVSLRGIAGLSGVTSGEAGLTLGALTPVADLAAHPLVARDWPVVAEAARALGSAQIRNVATVGGNLCNASPCADLAPALLVLDAQVRIFGARGERALALDGFFAGPGATRLEPGEIVTAVHVARAPGHATFLKRGRVAMDLALVSVAARLELDGERCRAARVAAGAVAPTPVRLRRVEALLEGRAPTPELLDQAAELAREEIAPISDLRASADYRRHLAGVMLRRALAELVGRGQP